MGILFYVFVMICSVIAGMGIGGGSIFILLCSIFSICEYQQSQMYNLIMFIAVGLSASFYNIKNKKIDTKILKKIIIFLIIGSVIGTFTNKLVDKDLSYKIFLAFMLLLGIYEIISSLKNIYKGKIKLDERS